MENERRKHLRVKVRVPIEICVERSDTPVRGTTSDLSLGGCYVETMFPFPKGTKLELKLEVADTLIMAGIVATSDSQVGNGIIFTRILPEDLESLRTFIETVSRTN